MLVTFMRLLHPHDWVVVTYSESTRYRTEYDNIIQVVVRWMGMFRAVRKFSNDLFCTFSHKSWRKPTTSKHFSTHIAIRGSYEVATSAAIQIKNNNKPIFVFDGMHFYLFPSINLFNVHPFGVQCYSPLPILHSESSICLANRSYLQNLLSAILR